MEIQKFLPDSTFIPFKASRLKNPSIVYANLELFQEYDYFLDFNSENDSFHQSVLDLFGYIVPVTEQDHSLVDDTQKEFLAERYGGVGILSNGGGGRCGLLGPFQLKGIGPTPVVGEGVNYWYGHGGLALQDALTELVYGHVACNALPYRSSRVLAVIDTGGFILRRSFKNHVNDTEDEQILVRRGLMLRESKIRPAHFARAFYFKPSAHVKSKYPHDFKRVQEAIPLFPEIAGSVDAKHSRTQQYIDAVKKVSSRAATQLSYSKVRRFMHGSLTLSNFLVDGGWIDFGSVTVVPAYEQLITASLQPPFWEEYNLFRKSIADLCFYIGKFQPDSRVIAGMTNDMFQGFVEIYLKQLRLLYVETTGIPIFLGQHLLNSPQYDMLGAILLQVASDEDTKPSISEWVLQCEGKAHTWKSKSLRSILQVFFYAYWIKRESATPVIPLKDKVAEDLWGCYFSISKSIEELAVTKNFTIEALAQFIGFNMTRQLFGVKPLYRGQLLQATDEIIEKSDSPEKLHENVSQLFREYDALANLHYSVPTEPQLLIAKSADGVCLYWDLIPGQYRLVIPLKAAGVLNLIPETQGLSLLINGQHSTFSFIPCINSYATYFGSTGTEWLNQLNNASVRGKVTVPLLQLFPHNRDLFEAYKATFSGLPPPSEESQYRFSIL